MYSLCQDLRFSTLHSVALIQSNFKHFLILDLDAWTKNPSHQALPGRLLLKIGTVFPDKSNKFLTTSIT